MTSNISRGSLSESPATSKPRSRRKAVAVLIDRLMADRLLLAKLAAPFPVFDNPLHAWEAQSLRDRILEEAGIRGPNTQ